MGVSVKACRAINDKDREMITIYNSCIKFEIPIPEKVTRYLEDTIYHEHYEYDPEQIEIDRFDDFAWIDIDYSGTISSNEGITFIVSDLPTDCEVICIKQSD